MLIILKDLIKYFSIIELQIFIRIFYNINQKP
jgi:hypothetical protein